MDPKNLFHKTLEHTLHQSFLALSVFPAISAQLILVKTYFTKVNSEIPCERYTTFIFICSTDHKQINIDQSSGGGGRKEGMNC